MSTSLGFGSWKSPITSALLTASGISFSELQFSNDKICWLESRPNESGRVAVVGCAPNGDPSDAIPVVSSVRERVFSEAAPTRAYTIILGALSLIAFALALSGTAGVVAYGVARRRNELALRMALGARGMTIVAMLLRGAVAMAGAGLVAGLLLSIASAHVLAPQLFGVEPFDPFTYIAVGTVLICATMAASLVPAFRAASIAVVSAMRYE